MMLGNTYHLALRPGAEVVQQLGGLHQFMGWDGPILTDSGGFQLFSLERLNRVTDEAAVFRSHIDGRLLTLSPERAVRDPGAAGQRRGHGAGPRGGAARRRRRRCATPASGRSAGPSAAGGRPGGADQALFAIVQGGLGPGAAAVVRRATGANWIFPAMPSAG